MGHGVRVDAAACQVVHRRFAQCVGELRRPAHSRPAPKQGRAHLGRRTGRPSHLDLLGPVPRSESRGQHAQEARRHQGRSCGDLHAHDCRGGRGHARVRTHRRHSHRGVRRLLSRVAARSHQRLRLQGAHHRRWWLSPRTDGAAQAQRRRSTEGVPHHRARARGDATPQWRGRRNVCRNAGRARPLVAPAQAAGPQVLRARSHGCRRRIVHSLHERHHRQTQRHRSHHRWLSHRRSGDDQVRVRLEGRRRVLVHRRHRVDYRPHVSHLWSARERHHVRDVRRRTRLA